MVRAARTTTYWVIRAFTAIAVTLASGFCPDSAVHAQADHTARYDAIARSFRNTKRLPIPLLEAETAWTIKLAVAPSAPAVMDADRIYLPLRDTGLVAINRETGGLAWSRPIATATTPTVGDGQVYVVGEGAIVAIDGVTGATRWSVPLEAVTTSLTWDSGWLIAVTNSGEVHALRASDGRPMWRQSVGSTASHPAVPGGANALYVSLSDGRVVALALETGERVWERQLSGTLSQPAVGRDRVFVGSTDNFFYALDAADGDEAWKWRNGGDVIGAAVDGDTVYFASLDNMLRAVNRGNGNQRWRKPTGTRPVLPPYAFRGVVVQPGLMPAITVFVGDDGEIMGTQNAAGDLIGTPLVDTAPAPFRVSMVTITREGVVEALRPMSLMFREGKTAPVSGLPGRALARERIE